MGTYFRTTQHIFNNGWWELNALEIHLQKGKKHKSLIIINLFIPYIKWLIYIFPKPWQCHWVTIRHQIAKFAFIIQFWKIWLNHFYFIPQRNPQIFINTTPGDEMNFVVNHMTQDRVFLLDWLWDEYSALSRFLGYVTWPAVLRQQCGVLD